MQTHVRFVFRSDSHLFEFIIPGEDFNLCKFSTGSKLRHKYLSSKTADRCYRFRCTCRGVNICAFSFRVCLEVNCFRNINSHIAVYATPIVANSFSNTGKFKKSMRTRLCIHNTYYHRKMKNCIAIRTI